MSTHVTRKDVMMNSNMKYERYCLTRKYKEVRRSDVILQWKYQTRRWNSEAFEPTQWSNRKDRTATTTAINLICLDTMIFTHRHMGREILCNEAIAEWIQMVSQVKALIDSRVHGDPTHFLTLVFFVTKTSRLCLISHRNKLNLKIQTLWFSCFLI